MLRQYIYKLGETYKIKTSGSIYTATITAIQRGLSEESGKVTLITYEDEVCSRTVTATDFHHMCLGPASGFIKWKDATVLA